MEVDSDVESYIDLNPESKKASMRLKQLARKTNSAHPVQTRLPSHSNSRDLQAYSHATVVRTNR